MALLVTHDIGGNQEGLDGFSLVDSPVDNGDYYTFDGVDDGLQKGSYGDETTIDIYCKIRIHDKAKGVAQIFWKSGGASHGIAVGIDASGNLGLFGRSFDSLTSNTIPATDYSNDVWYELYANTSKICLKNISTGELVESSSEVTPGSGSDNEAIGVAYTHSPITGADTTSEYFDGDVDIVELWDSGTLTFPTSEETATEDFKTDIKAEGWGKADIVLDLSAYFQKLENLKLDIKLHGWSLENLPLDLDIVSESSESLSDSHFDLSAYYQKIEDMKTDLLTWGDTQDDIEWDAIVAGWEKEDKKLDISAGLQALESMSFGIQAAKEISNINAQIDINTTDGINTQDSLFDLEITDGTLLYDAGLDLAVIEVMPSFKAVYAMHLESVITEI